MSDFFSPDLGNLTATAILGWYAWHAGLEGVDSLILGGLNYDIGYPVEGPYDVQDRFAGYLSTVLIYGATTANGSLSDAQNLDVENWARQLANV
jgi:hypothetical protein